jgi:hypothetical protein
MVLILPAQIFGSDLRGAEAKSRVPSVGHIAVAEAERVTWLRRAGASLVGALVVVGSLAVSSTPALADRGETVPDASSNVYTVRPDGSVHVDVTATISNHGSCPAGYVCWYDTVGLPVPSAAVAVASDAGSVHTSAEDRFFEDAIVTLSSRLYVGNTRTIHVGFDLVGGPRQNPFVRTNAAYSEFYAFGSGNNGQVDVTVVVPDTFKATVDFATMAQHDDGTNTTYTATGIADPGKWAAAVTARNDAALVHHSMTIDGHVVSLRSWPGDDQWASFVESQVRRGVPVLERLVASPLPKKGTLEITETAAPYLYGYAGWYTAAKNTIEIGDDLDATVVLHEISHEWFNSDRFVDRWVNEGLAQEYSTRAVAALGEKAEQPTTPSAKDSGHLALDDWSHPDFRSSVSDAQEQYGYNASFYVMRQVSDEIGVARMRTVIQSALRGDLTYRGTVAVEHRSDAVGWRQLLDLFDDLGGSKRADGLFQRYAVSSSELPELAARRDARAAYARLTARAGSWGAPLAVRVSMADWSFAEAKSRIATATQLLATRDDIEHELAPYHVALLPALRTEYASTRDLAATGRDLEDVHTTALRVVQAHTRVGAKRGLWQRVGLLGADPESHVRRADAAFAAGQYTTAATEADAATSVVAGAASAGRTRALIALGILLATVVAIALIPRVRRARRRRREQPDAEPPIESAVPDDALVGAGAPLGAAPPSFAVAPGLAPAPPTPPPPPQPAPPVPPQPAPPAPPD